MDELIVRWRRAVSGAGALAEVDSVGAALLARWREPQRHYHTLEHLVAMLTIIDAAAGEADDADAVRLAAFYHDAVYDPTASGNEEASADLAAADLAALGVPEPTVARVRRLVLLTAGHEATAGDRDGALLCDADLAILAGEPAAYDRYAAAVRREYAHVPDELFRLGRAAVLRQLRDLPALYRLPSHAARWTAAARANLERELAMLEDN